MQVPFVDLKANYHSIQLDINDAIHNVLEDSAFIKGKYLEDFEKNWAYNCNCKYCAGTSNGTTALELALRAIKITTGDQVILPSHTFIATAEAVVNCGATPVFCEIEADTGLIDIDKIKFTDKTKAIIIVDIYGQPADYQALKKKIDKENRDIIIIEDAAQSHLGEHYGKKVGSYADLTTFSFYPGKNLGAYGDAGAVCTNNEDYHNYIKMMLDHGRTTKYSHEIIGYNYRMDSLQAAILSVKMKYLPEWTNQRRSKVKYYHDNLSNELQFMKEKSYNKAVYHLCVARTIHREELFKFLKSNDIGVGIHYPIPLHNQPVYKQKYNNEILELAEKLSSEVISLPIYPEIPQKAQDYVIDKIKYFFNTKVQK